MSADDFQPCGEFGGRDDGPAEGEFDGIEAVAFRSGGYGAEEFEDFAEILRRAVVGGMPSVRRA